MLSHTITRHRRKGLHPLLGAGLALLSAGVAGCGNTKDMARRTCHELGEIPPGLHANLRIDVPAPAVPVTLGKVASSCGCLAVSLAVGGQQVTLGHRIGPEDALAVILQFAPPRNDPGAGQETVHLGYEDAAGRSWTHDVELRYRIDVSRSAFLDAADLTFERTAPVRASRQEVRLREHTAPEHIRIDEQPWLHVEDLVVVEGGARLQLALGPADAAGLYETDVRVDLDGQRTEFAHIRMRVNAPAGYALSPASLVLSLPSGGEVAHPVTLTGPSVAVRPADAEWAVTGPVEAGLAGIPDSAPRTGLGLEVIEQDAGRASLLFRVTRSTPAGLHRGRLLLRPAPGADFRLELPYLVRVY